jgi:flagellin
MLGPSAGTVNTSDVLTGSVKIGNATFSMGASAYNSGALAATGIGTNTLLVNGDTIADLARAITADSATDGVRALAGTTGIQLTTTTNTGTAIGLSGTNTLTDMTQGTDSVVTLGEFASESDTLSGSLTFTVGAGTPQVVPTTQGETVDQLIAAINSPSATYGVKALWVPVVGGNGYGNIQLTSNNTGTAGQISNASSTIVDTATTATLNYVSSSAYNTGLSDGATNLVYDSTSQQSDSAVGDATFVSNQKAGSGIATTSYSDGAGQALNGTDLLVQADAESALTELNTAVTDIAAQDGYIGAQINTLNSISQVMSTQQENVVSAQNAIQATDYASATSNMSKYEILSQTGIAALAQANSVQQEVTKLLQ